MSVGPIWARGQELWYNFGMCVRSARDDAGERRGSAAEMPRFRKSLRNANINYRNGWFFVTWQTAHNKSIFGAIVGDRCALNELGRRVEAYWRELPAKYPELELDEFVVMPNHFHAIVRIKFRPTNKEHHLGFLLGRFKGGTGYIYGKMRRAGEVEDIGDHLWQFDYWDKIVTSERQLAAFRRYIRENPANWTRDRFGAVTQYSLGNLDLLNGPRIAFVASHGFWASDLKPKMVWRRNEVRRSDIGGAAVSVCGASTPHDMPIISTFTSAQEREALRRALAKGRSALKVVPQGLPLESELSNDLLAALAEGRILFISPQRPGSRLNKKVAAWCNEYVLRHADEIWVGDIAPNGMLATMMKAMGRYSPNRAARGEGASPVMRSLV